VCSSALNTITTPAATLLEATRFAVTNLQLVAEMFRKGGPAGYSSIRAAGLSRWEGSG
jgi:hypothetical protein